MSRYIWFLAALVITFAGSPAWAETVYVTSATAKIYSRPSSGASIVTAVKKNEPLMVIEKAGMYYRVKTRGGKQGYVQRARVSTKAPSTPSAAKGDDLDQLLSVLGGGRSTTIEEGSSSHAIRGLKSKGASGASGVTGEQAEAEVKRMESFTVNDSRKRAFQKEGKVGAYAK